MPKFKNIRVKMRGGKSRLQRVQVLASGKYKFVKNITTRARRLRKRVRQATTRSRRSNVKRRVKRTVRRYRRKRRGGGGKSIMRTAFKFIRLGALLAPGAIHYSRSTGDPIKRVGRALMAYGGVELDGRFNFDLLARMWSPFLATCAATYGIPKIAGIIRKIA